MSSSSLKNELANHIYQYLCHEAQYSDLPEEARESLTAASECIEQAYKLNVNSNANNNQNTNTTNNNNNINSHSRTSQQQQQTQTSDVIRGILPDELLRIFTRHKEFLANQQQLDSSLYNSMMMIMRNQDTESSSSSNNNPNTNKLDKPDIRIISSHPSNDSHCNSNPNSPAASNNAQIVQAQTTNSSSSTTTSSSGQAKSSSNSQQQQQQQQPTTTKQHGQHTISQLPMTTRKKLSHLRAQIKRQASKAARSRLEKRSSVAGVISSTSSGGTHGTFSSFMGTSLDLASGPKQTGGDNLKDSHHHHHHQPSSTSSIDSPNAHYLTSTATASPSSGGGGGGSGAGGGAGPGTGSKENQADLNTNANLSPSLHNQHKDQQQHNESGSGPSSSGHHKQSGSHLMPGSHHHHHHSIGVSVHQKNFKQKLIALIKKFRTDGSDFDSEEQYREALERELMKAAAGRGSRDIEELLEEDIDVEEESGSETEDWDNISESSTPKPSLRPFFSSTTLDKI